MKKPHLSSLSGFTDMRRLCMIAMAAAFFATCGRANGIEKAWLYVHIIGWTSPPAQLEKSYQEGDAEILILSADGSFAAVSVTLFRDNASQAVSVCEGCGYSLRTGTWKRLDLNRIKELSTLTHADVPTMGSAVGEASPHIEITWSVEADQPDAAPISIMRQGRHYARLRAIANLDVLNRMLSAQK